MDAAKGRLERWIELNRLPQSEGFCFSEPNRMSPEDALLLASWIVKGELGLLKPDEVFRWIGQEDPIQARGPARPELRPMLIVE